MNREDILSMRLGFKYRSIKVLTILLYYKSNIGEICDAVKRENQEDVK